MRENIASGAKAYVAIARNEKSTRHLFDALMIGMSLREQYVRQLANMYTVITQ